MTGKRVSQAIFVLLSVVGALLEAGVFGEEVRASGRALMGVAVGQNLTQPFGKDE